MWRLIVTCGFGWVLAAGCGGRVEGGETGSTDSEPSEPDGTPGRGSSDGAWDFEADTELGTCKLGPSAYESFGQPCAWIADERCYSTRDMACNCACPRSGTSQCVSGFDEGPDGRVPVGCK